MSVGELVLLGRFKTWVEAYEAAYYVSWGYDRLLVRRDIEGRWSTWGRK
jgi:hypothetical protein